MKKRSKRLLAMQQNLPWSRVLEHPDTVYLPNKKATRWSEGAARELKTTVLNGLRRQEFSNVLRDTLFFDQERVQAMSETKSRDRLSPVTKKSSNTFRQFLWTMKFLVNKSNKNRREFSYKEKNSCFFLGKGRTFNRRLLIARHTLRNLSSFGLISGLRGF